MTKTNGLEVFGIIGFVAVVLGVLIGWAIKEFTFVTGLVIAGFACLLIHPSVPPAPMPPSRPE